MKGYTLSSGHRVGLFQKSSGNEMDMRTQILCINLSELPHKDIVKRSENYEGVTCEELYEFLSDSRLPLGLGVVRVFFQKSVEEKNQRTEVSMKWLSEFNGQNPQSLWALVASEGTESLDARAFYRSLVEKEYPDLYSEDPSDSDWEPYEKK